MSQQRRKIIAVIGGERPSPEEAKMAEEVGRELAMQGAILVGGGLGGGVVQGKGGRGVGWGWGGAARG